MPNAINFDSYFDSALMLHLKQNLFPETIAYHMRLQFPDLPVKLLENYKTSNILSILSTIESNIYNMDHLISMLNWDYGIVIKISGGLTIL